jgi:hypothetical protein
MPVLTPAHLCSQTIPFKMIVARLAAAEDPIAHISHAIKSCAMENHKMVARQTIILFAANGKMADATSLMDFTFASRF